MVYRGTAVTQGVGRAVVTATGMDTEMGAIAELLEATDAEPSPLQRELAQVGRYLGLAVVVIAVVVIAVTLALSEIRSLHDLVTVLLLGVSLAVAAVPEGLPAIVSVVLAIGVQRMAARNAIVTKPAVGGDPRLCHRDRLRQDRHADPERDDHHPAAHRVGRGARSAESATCPEGDAERRRRPS